MIKGSLKDVVRRHKQMITDNEKLDKEYVEEDKIDHQTSVLGIISSTTVNGGRQKGSTNKNKKIHQEKMDEAKIHITHFFLGESINIPHLTIVTFHLLHNYVITKMIITRHNSSSLLIQSEDASNIEQKN